MAVRYLIGNELFNRLFQFEKGEFTISQQCYEPVSPADKLGYLLFHFYDWPIYGKVGCPLDPGARIKLRAFFNHPRCLSKHPKGAARDVYETSFKSMITTSFFAQGHLKTSCQKENLKVP